MTLTLLAAQEGATIIPPELDPRLASYVKTQVKRLRLLNGSQRAFLVLERYPELRDMALVDWERLSYWPAYSVLFWSRFSPLRQSSTGGAPGYSAPGYSAAAAVGSGRAERERRGAGSGGPTPPPPAWHHEPTVAI